MTTRKKILLGIAAAAVFGAGIVGVVFYATRGLPESADAFFTQVASGKASEAYRSTATEFQAGTSEREFLQFLRTSSLGDYQSASWSSRSIENSRGHLEGTVTTKAGGKIPLSVEFVKEGGGWKIYAIHKDEGGLTDTEPDVTENASALPSDAEAKRLARATLVALHRAVEANDFTAFYQEISPLWQRQVSAADLQSQFQSLIDGGLDLSGVVTAPVQWTEAPALDDRNVLLLRGHAPGVPDASSAFGYDLDYYTDAGQWKLVGIHVLVR